jgi:hypothetical protein
MASRNPGVTSIGQDDRYPQQATILSWASLPLVGLPPWEGYDGPERRGGKGRRGFERRFETRADSPDRRVGPDRRLGHWRCQDVHLGSV